MSKSVTNIYECDLCGNQENKGCSDRYPDNWSRLTVSTIKGVRITSDFDVCNECGYMSGYGYRAKNKVSRFRRIWDKFIRDKK